MSQIQHQIQISAQKTIELAIARMEIEVAGIDIRIEIGTPSLRLIEVNNEINADLIVMRANHSESILEKIIGSTTDRVIRTSHTPVLVVKRPVTQAYQRIVLSIDTFDDSAVVAPFVAALFPLAGLQLNHVVQISTQFEVAMQRAGSGQAGIVAHRDALINRAKKFLRDLSQKLANRPQRTVVRVVVGDPATSLVRATWNPIVELIVLGPGSTSRIRWTLLGSVTRRVLRAATCDVLICRTDQQDAEQ